MAAVRAAVRWNSARVPTPKRRRNTEASLGLKEIFPSLLASVIGPSIKAVLPHARHFMAGILPVNAAKNRFTT
jgi:hypothetical protein